MRSRVSGQDVSLGEVDGTHVSRSTARDRLVELMNRYEQPLSSYLLVLLTDRDAVRDCVQETFLRAYEHLERGRTVNGQWLYKVARNKAIDHLRHRERMRTEPEVLASIENPEPTEPERVMAVRRTLARLSPDDAEILYLFVVDGFETAEIGAMLGARPGAIRVRLSRARERFRTIHRGDR